MKDEYPEPVGMALELSGAAKAFGSTAVFNIPELTIDAADFVAVVGPSGCGKSTLLACLAGLEPLSTGSARVRDRPVDLSRMPVGFVFQRSGIFPWLSVRDNIRVPGTATEALSNADVDIVLGRFDLHAFADAWPRQLSGGMLRRLEVARAIAANPGILLLDEPFSALDPVSKAAMHSLVREVHRTAGSTIVIVTHDVDEAISLANRIIVLSPRPGRIIADMRVDLADEDRSIHSTAPGFIRVRANVLGALGWS